VPPALSVPPGLPHRPCAGGPRFGNYTTPTTPAPSPPALCRWIQVWQLLPALPSTVFFHAKNRPPLPWWSSLSAAQEHRKIPARSRRFLATPWQTTTAGQNSNGRLYLRWITKLGSRCTRAPAAEWESCHESNRCPAVTFSGCGDRYRRLGDRCAFSDSLTPLGQNATGRCVGRYVLI